MMGWQVGFDSRWNRDIGYGVPAECDHPGCEAPIDRGLAYVCGGQPYGGEHGCGLYFCSGHLLVGLDREMRGVQQCERCADGEPPFDPTPDTAEWMEWKLTEESWGPWRDENPETVATLRQVLAPLG
jgi:hypothetical protein